VSGPAIVLVDHGSREATANAVVEDVAAALRARLPGRIVEVAHLELAAPGIPEAIARCVARGAREIVVQPFFLAPGRHSGRDVPRLVDEAAVRHPGVSIALGEPLGAHPALVDALLDRISAGAGPPRSG
jgi:sirohydrochlorin ferrochelatase